MTRHYGRHEDRLVSEYIKLYFSKGRVLNRVRLGSAPEDAKKKYGVEMANRLFKTSFKWADAMIIEKHRVIIIEGKIKAVLTAISQLKFYGLLFRKSEDYEKYWDLPLELWIVAPWFDEETREFAESEGIRCVEFVPDWIGPYLEERQHYWSSDYKIERERKKEIIEKALGGV